MEGNLLWQKKNRGQPTSNSTPILGLVLGCAHGYTTKIIFDIDGQAMISPGADGPCPLTPNGGLCGTLATMGSLVLIDQNAQPVKHYALSVQKGRASGNDSRT